MAGRIGSDNRSAGSKTSIWGVAVLIVLVLVLLALLRYRVGFFDFVNGITEEGDLLRTIWESGRTRLWQALIFFFVAAATSTGVVAGKMVFGVWSSKFDEEAIALVTWRALAFIGLTGLLVTLALSDVGRSDFVSGLFYWIAVLAIALGIGYAKAEVSGLVSTESELQATRAELEKTSTRLGDTEAELDETRRILEETEGELKETNDELEGTRFLLRELEVELEETNAELEGTSTELEKMRTEFEETSAELKLAEDGLEETSVRLESAERELEATNAELSETKWEADEAKTKLGEAEAELEKTRAKLGEMSTDSKEVEAELEETRIDLENASAELAELKAELDKASVPSKETDVALAETKAKLAEKRDEVEDLRTELEEIRTESERTTTELEETLLTLGSTEDKLNETRTKLAETQKELDEYLIPDPDLSPTGLVLENVGDEDGAEALVKLTNKGEETIHLGGCSMVDGDGKRFRFPRTFDLDAGDAELFEIAEGFDIESTEPVRLYCDSDDDPDGLIRWRG